MAEVVEAPPVQPPRYGLIAAAPVVDETGRWETGFEFEPGRCGAGGRIRMGCGFEDEDMTPDSARSVLDGEPFLIYASDRCSPKQRRDYAAMARAQLEAVRSFELAEELWTGSLGLPQRRLTSPASDLLTSGAATPVEALACLEQGLGSCYKGRRGMIHVTPQLLTHLMAESAVRVEGGLVLTALGTIVVADAGYDGSGPADTEDGAPTPAASTQWAYATGMIQVMLGRVEVTPDVSTDEGMSFALNRANNTVTVYANQPAAWKWDECCHLAAEVDLPVCLIGGAS